ncbi:hypothetical protein [Leifsonia sp. Le1]|uniref:hypothetical protein n=1 Tax=Leifsonia sp. Le1 TaxID=3404918 RepID=UPI003EB98D88
MRPLRRAVLPLTAQILFTLAQLSVTIAGSATLHPDEWGRFALLLSVFFIAMSLVRGFSSVPVLVFLSGDEHQARDAKRASSVVGLIVAIPTSTAVAVTGVLLGAPGLGALLGASMLTYTLYDCARAVELAAGRFGRIVLSDGVVLILLSTASVFSFLPGAAPSIVLPLAMVVAYASGASVLAVGHRAQSPWTLRMFVAEYRADMPFLALDGVLLASVLGSFVIVIGAASSLTQAGAFRTCLALLIGPLQAVQNSLSPLAIRSLRQSAKAHGESPDGDTRRGTLRQPALFVTAGLASGAVYGLIVSVVAMAVVAEIELPIVESALPYAFAGAVLVSALWASSIFSSFMRYRRPNSELTAVRLVTLVASLSAFTALTVLLHAELSAALLVGSIPLVLIPATHVLARWRPVSRVFSPPPSPRTILSASS